MIWVVEWMAEYDVGGKGVWRPWTIMEPQPMTDPYRNLEGDDLTEVIDQLINREQYEDTEDSFHVRIRNTETGETIPMEALCL